MLPSGNVITEQPFVFLPGYGRTNVLWTRANGWSPDMQHDQYEQVWRVPPPDIRRLLTDPASPHCPLSRFIGNEQAKRVVQRAAYQAWGRPNHCCADLSFAMVGPASSGKTTLARLFAETVRLPVIEIPPNSIRSSRELYDQIAVTLERTINTDDPDDPFSLKMVPPAPGESDDPTMHVPPSIVFIDEAHGLPRDVRDGLLKAIESKDRMLCIEGGWYADCKNVCWVVATTERGKLFGPFDSRFTKVELGMYEAEEIAAIVQLDNPGWNLPLCRLVAQFAGRIPREALDFAKAIVQEHEMNGGMEWEATAARVARSLKIDRYGLTRQRLVVLVALGQLGATSKGRMADFAGCGLEELEKFVMPALLVSTPDEPAMVVVTNKGYAITRRGLEELDRRSIPHRGEEVVAEGGQRLDFGDYDSDNFGVEEGDELPAKPAMPRRKKPSGGSFGLPAPQPPSLPVLTPPTITPPSPPAMLPPPGTKKPQTLAEILQEMRRLMGEARRG
jgi:Holliday junction resolvasome RuvABC ATP-dependent DNA helicase subunit